MGAPGRTARPGATAVLVIGGGLVGLSTSMLLSWFGIANVLVERRPTTSRHPRARGVNVRTMEILRTVGLEEAVRSTSSARALAANHGILAAESLTGRQFGPVGGDVHRADPRPEAWARLSPTSWTMCDQDELEPLIADRARALGATLLFGHELADLDADGTAHVLDVATGEEFRVATEYVVAADGAGSPTRRRLGIGTTGPGRLARFANIHFHADLADALGDRRFVLCYLRQEGFAGALLPIDNARRWLLHVPLDEDWSAAEHRFDAVGARELVRRGTGLPGLEVDVRGVLPWESAGRVADRWRDGRLLLAGDAVHVMPPTGAFGSNTGIQDAHNLAWKLAAVLGAGADPQLLDTYEAERRPVAIATMEQAVLRSADRGGRTGEASGALVADAEVILGYRYSSAAVRGDATGAGAVLGPVATGEPGARAPHVPVPGGGSLLDRYGRSFVLVSADPTWTVAAEKLAADDEWLEAVVVTGEQGRVFSERYGVTACGAVLVRPDGFVGWRSSGAAPDPETVVRDALATVIGRVR